jgi:hypothetical protein
MGGGAWDNGIDTDWNKWSMWELIDSLINKWTLIFLVEFKVNCIMVLRLTKDAVFNCEIYVQLQSFLWQVRCKDLE